jgi:hypothetical protein
VDTFSLGIDLIDLIFDRWAWDMVSYKEKLDLNATP